MLKFTFGIFVGILLIHLYPNILDGFVDSGARDIVIDKLKEL